MRISFTLSLLFISFCLFAQRGIDGVSAVIGDELILKSDIEKEVSAMVLQGRSKEIGRCEVMEKRINEKLLITKGLQDSIEVTENEVQAELDQRLNYFISQAGSEQALEDFYDKSIPEIKEMMHDPVKDMILSRKVRQKIQGNVQVSPKDVKQYFNSIPTDSLPVYSAEVEVGQIVIYAKPTNESTDKSKSELEKLRKRIMEGLSFENAAVLYSEDNSNANLGGDLGMRNKDEYVAPFASAALKLSKDSISHVIQTRFGFHLIKLVDRRGDNIHVKHILLRPDITYESEKQAQNMLDSIRNEILNDTLTFREAAIMYSDDEMTRNNGGMLTDPQTASTRVPVDQMSLGMFYVVDTMEIGSISTPLRYTDPTGNAAYRILQLKNRIPQHTANLELDYPRLKTMASEVKKNEHIEQWFDEFREETYIRIDEDYNYCPQLSFYFNKTFRNN